MDGKLPWPRFWVPHSYAAHLNKSGLLADAAVSSDPNFETLEQLDEHHLLVLLGDPGTGKTTAISDEISRIRRDYPLRHNIHLDGSSIGSDYALDREWVNSASYRDWLESDYDLWIFFDGFDQCQKSDSNRGLGRRIKDILRDAPIERLFLRVSARSAEWDYGLGTDLNRIFFPEQSSDRRDSASYLIAPLRTLDVDLATQQAGIDTALFLQALTNTNLGPIATRPIGLKWLIQRFAKHGNFPDSAVDLYWDISKVLSEDIEEVGNRDGVTATIARQVAARIAFVLGFSSTQFAWTGPDFDDVSQDKSQPVARFAGGTETIYGDDHNVSEQIVRSVLKRGLFSGIDDNRVGWSHQTYLEFLAAKYCVDRDLPMNQILGLLTNPHDPTSKVVQQLREIAAWIAAMDNRMLEFLIHRDPKTLLESDVALQSDQQRATLFDGFVKGISAGEVVLTRWYQRGEFSDLRYNGLEAKARNLLLDRSLSPKAREVVVQVVRDCRCIGLTSELAYIALDSDEPEVLRIACSAAIYELDSRDAKEELRPLITEAALDSSLSSMGKDQLRGFALRSVWDGETRVPELLREVTEPFWHGVGSYASFLFQFPKSLSVKSIPHALNWLRKQERWPVENIRLETIELDLISKAWNHVSDDGVLEALASYMVSTLLTKHRLFSGYGSRDEMSALVQDSTARRKVLAKVFSLFSSMPPDQQESLQHLAFTELMLPADFDWYMTNASDPSEAGTKRQGWLNLALHVFDSRNPRQIQTLFDFNEQFNDFGLQQWFDAVDIHSEESKQRKKSWQMFNRTPGERVRNEETVHHMDGLIVSILEHMEQGHSERWWAIDKNLMFDVDGLVGNDVGDWSADLRRFPGWERSGDLLRSRLVAVASRYLEARDPELDVLGTNTYYQADCAGYRALVLIREEAKEAYDSLDAGTWQKWGPVILAFTPQTSSDQIPFQHDLLKDAFQHGFDWQHGLELIALQEDVPSTYHFSSALKATCDVLRETHSECDPLEDLAGVFIDAKWRVEVVEETVRLLVDRYEVTNASELAVSWAKTYLESYPESTSRISNTLGTILVNHADQHWDGLWPLISASDELRHGVLTYFDWMDHRERQLLSMLTEHQLAALYAQIAADFPPQDDPEDVRGFHAITFRESIGRWRDSVLRHLASMGTWEAVDALERLQTNLPTSEWIVVETERAREQARIGTWTAPTGIELMEIARTPARRLVSNAAQLLEAVLESLERLQLALPSAAPVAAGWWNYPYDPERAAPKDENEISDHIANHLQQELMDSGIIVNREVEMRRLNRKDIVLDVAVPVAAGHMDRVSVICEVKGCWNRDLMLSQELQLRDRYLAQEGFSHGVYIVAFFDGDRWLPSDRRTRHNASRNHTVEQLRDELGIQAVNLSRDGKVVRPVVLDVNF